MRSTILHKASNETSGACGSSPSVHMFLLFTSVAALGTLCLVGARAEQPKPRHGLASCIEQKVDFDGTTPLHFQSVKQSAGSRLYLHREYPKGCPSAGDDDAKCETNAYIAPGDVVAVGKECSTWAYVQYVGSQQVSYGWVAVSGLMAVPGADSWRTDRASIGVENQQKRAFRLTVGRGKPVCEAYLQRLNLTASEVPPYCGRPESDVVPGFSRLHRVPLTADQYNSLSADVWEFTHGTTGVWVPKLASGTVAPGAWTYASPIDIENEKKPLNLLVWQGYGASTYAGECGTIGLYGLPDDVGLRQAQIAYVLKKDESAIDQDATRQVFSRASDQYRSSSPSPIPPPYRPAGLSMGIFEYRGVYYFDTFFDGTGDFRDQRRDDPTISNTLGVFENRAGKTSQVCELQMNGRDFDNTFFRRLPQ